MIPAYISAMRRYACFAGRSSRGEFWWFHLSFVVLLLAAAMVDSIVSGDPETTGAPVITGLVLLAHVLPAIAISVRRLHDVDLSGWFFLVGLVPVIGPIILLVSYCRPSAARDNRFGAAPPATSAAAANAGQPNATMARDLVAEIERLARMQASGTLSSAEFETLKARVLAGTALA